MRSTAVLAEREIITRLQNAGDTETQWNDELTIILERFALADV